MNYEAKTKTRDDYYSNLIKYFTVPVDIIGIILSFILWDLQIGDLVVARDQQYENHEKIYYDGIIVDIRMMGWLNKIPHYKIHYIGWDGSYNKAIKICQIKPYDNIQERTYDRYNRLNVLYAGCKIEINQIIKSNKIHKLISIVLYNNRMVREIITDFPVVSHPNIYIHHYEIYNSILFIFRM